MRGETNYWQRRTLTRRRFAGTAATAGTGLAGLALVGCGGDDDTKGKAGGVTSASGAATASASSPQAAQPKQGGDLFLASGAVSTQSMDPHTTLNLSFTHWSLIANKFITPDRQKLEPLKGELVESWEQPDKTTLTLKVRQGVKYHEGHLTNGRAFTAQDVAYNLLRIAAKLPEDDKRKAQFQRAGTLQNLDKAEAVDDRTVRVTLSAPNSQFLNGIADWRNWPVPREVPEKDVDFKDVKNFSGTGPFMVESWDASTMSGKYVRNPNYWKQGQPYVNSVQQVQLPDAAASLAAFITGKVTYIDAFGAERRADIEKGKPDAKILAWEHTGWEYIRLDQRKEQFKDPRVRRAIFLALDFEEMLTANYGKGQFWDFTGPLVSGFPGTWSTDDLKKMAGWKDQSADVAEAKKLIEAAGFADGNGLSFAITPYLLSGYWYDLGIYAKDRLEKVFPKMKISTRTTSDAGEFARWLGTGDYEAISYGSFPPPSPVLEANLHYRSGGSRNYTKFNDADVDRLIDGALSEYDSAARGKLLGELQQKLLDSIFVMPVGKRRTVYAHQPNLRGFAEWVGPGTYEGYNVAFSADSVWFA